MQGPAKIKSVFSEKDSKNCTNFMKSLFEKEDLNLNINQRILTVDLR